MGLFTRACGFHENVGGGEMKCKIIIDGKEKEVTISGITKSHRREFIDHAKALSKLDKNDSIDDAQKIDKALEVTDWLEKLGLDHSDLTPEEKEGLDLEASDIITSTSREILQPDVEKKR